MRRNGLFITLEGGECCGKGTQIKYLKDSLAKAYPQKDIINVYDPGYTKIGNEIRKLVKKIGGNDAPTCFTELFLFVAARNQLVEKVIHPNLEKDNIVICDRFIDSTTIYQGKMNKNSLDKIMKINDLIDCTPDLTFILDIDSKTFKERISKRKKFDRFDSRSIEYHNQVYKEYRNLYSEEVKKGRNIYLINSVDKPEIVNDNILDIIFTYINKEYNESKNN